MKRPLIAITTNFENVSKFRKYPTADEFEFSHTRWAKVVYQHGGLPVYMSSTINHSDCSSILERIDGLLLSGGIPDISPRIYGEKKHPLCGEFRLIRDNFEISLVNKAVECKVPVLGICRGLQIINAAFGGSLYQDLTLMGTKAINHRNTKVRDYSNFHFVEIENNSRLCYILKQRQLLVNTSHHQAINRLGNNLKVTGRAEDGIAEALEFRGDSYLIAVQWHPETMPNSYSTKCIMGDFISNCK